MTRYEELKARKMESQSFKRFYDLAMIRKKKGVAFSTKKIGHLPTNPSAVDQLKQLA